MKTVWENLTCKKEEHSIVVIGWMMIYGLMHVFTVIMGTMTFPIIKTHFLSEITLILFLLYVSTLILTLSTYRNLKQPERKRMESK